MTLDVDINILNNFYAEISNQPHSLHPPQKPDKFLTYDQKFFPKIINAGELHLAYISTKNKHGKSPDFNGISPLMMKMCIECPNIHNSLLKIINTSLSTSTFPNNLKTSAITPIPKIKNANFPEYFRPVASQPI